ncbi:MAG: alpha/beta hydrolase-fold protein [Flavobacteriaceae bacterium]|nr:alpha/beta hydrolase-fold protein [Flavobacteriaceae bacterium]
MQKPTLSLHHLVRKPLVQIAAKPPLLIMLHGYGSNEEDLFSFADYLPTDLLIVSLRAPHQMPPYGYAWYAIHWDNTDGKFSDIEQAKASQQLLLQVLEELKNAYDFDSKNIGLLGFSQGAILSLATALSYPILFKYVVALSGYLNQKLLIEKPLSSACQHLSVFASHGIQDPVIPVAWARETPVFLDDLGVKNQYFEYAAGHTVSRENFEDLLKWFAQRD